MIFVMDVDGTICFNGLFIEDILHSEIERIGKNHQIIFASARPIRDLLPVVKGFESPILIVEMVRLFLLITKFRL